MNLPTTIAPGRQRQDRSTVALRAFVSSWFILLLAAPAIAELAIDANFPGGAVDVVQIDQAQGRIEFKIPQQKNGGWQAWWYFKVTGIDPGRTITLQVLNGQAPAGRAVWSTDRKTWKYTEPVEGQANGNNAAARRGRLYLQKIDAPEAWFAWYVPHLPEDIEALAREAAKKPFVKIFELCRSEEDRPVIGFRIAEGDLDKDADKRPGVWVQGRQHAWEAGGSWSAQGLIEWLISDDPRAASLRRSATITVVPIIDVDSVAGGRGGKDQRPHDHNRDWIEKPRWNAVNAAMAMLKAMDQAGRLDVFLDLHDPGWAGAVEFWCHTYNIQAPQRKANTDLFLAAMKREITGPLVFNGKAIARYALTTPTSGIWASSKTRDKVVGGTFEIGVAPPKGFGDPPPAHHRICGQQIGLGLERYLADEKRNR